MRVYLRLYFFVGQALSSSDKGYFNDRPPHNSSTSVKNCRVLQQFVKASRIILTQNVTRNFYNSGKHSIHYTTNGVISRNTNAVDDKLRPRCNQHKPVLLWTNQEENCATIGGTPDDGRSTCSQKVISKL